MRLCGRIKRDDEIAIVLKDRIKDQERAGQHPPFDLFDNGETFFYILNRAFDL